MFLFSIVKKNYASKFYRFVIILLIFEITKVYHRIKNYYYRISITDL